MASIAAAVPKSCLYQVLLTETRNPAYFVYVEPRPGTLPLFVGEGWLWWGLILLLVWAVCDLCKAYRVQAKGMPESNSFIIITESHITMYKQYY